MGRGSRGRHFFFEILYYFYRILRKIKSIYKAGKCPGHPCLNFLDPPLLMYVITCAGKSTTPLDSLASGVTCLREKLNKDSRSVANRSVKDASPRILSPDCATLFSPRYLRLFVELRGNPHQTQDAHNYSKFVRFDVFT